jgi:cytochrome c-type biogenesis protein CcmH
MRPVLTLVALALASVSGPFAWAQQSTRTLQPESIVGPPRGQALSGPALDARTAEVASLLRCPVCQGLSVADSPASMAQDMRAEVRDLLAQGFDQDQILAYFERSYGEFVRLKPPLRGINWFVWVAPLAALLAGIWWVRMTLRRSAAPSAVSGEKQPPAQADEALQPYLARVRALAYGWPAGVKAPREDKTDA